MFPLIMCSLPAVHPFAVLPRACLLALLAMLAISFVRADDIVVRQLEGRSCALLTMREKTDWSVPLFSLLLGRRP
jgi:hypothetical protein